MANLISRVIMELTSLLFFYGGGGGEEKEEVYIKPFKLLHLFHKYQSETEFTVKTGQAFLSRVD